MLPVVPFLALQQRPSRASAVRDEVEASLNVAGFEVDEILPGAGPAGP
ncbi:hypothetical protein [Streptomyces poriticola]